MAAYGPDDYFQLSALQHYVYCRRQCALIHLDRIWEENLHTAEGRLLHEKADSGKSEKRGDLKTVSGLLLHSKRHGVSGKADVVEFHREGRVWRPYPVEYKRGRPKKHDGDIVQLCMQALCLEEMLGLEVPEGALFYGKTRRRLRVFFTPETREKTIAVAREVHALLADGELPEPANDDRCTHCSLSEACMPGAIADRSRAARYLDSLVKDNGDGL